MAEIPAFSTSLVLPAFGQPLTLVKSPVEANPSPGTVLVRVLCTGVRPHSRASFVNKGPLSMPAPNTPGYCAVARVLAVGPDAAVLKPGQLVFVDSLVRARDDPHGTQILLGMHQGYDPSEDSNTKKLFRAWKGLWTDVAAVQMETCIALDEERLARMGYGPRDLTFIDRLAVATGAARAAEIRPGETVIVGPASGHFTGAVVELAAQLGCRVIALTRSTPRLARLAALHPTRVSVVETTGDVAADTAAILAACSSGSSSSSSRGADALIDMTPGSATGSPNAHLAAALAALRPGARVAMGGTLGAVTLPYALLMSRNINVRFRFMYTRDDLVDLVQQIENGLIRLGERAGHGVDVYALADWEAATVAAEKALEWGQQVVFEP